MDYGMLTDNQGRKADFRNAILIMTSNVGAHDTVQKVANIGFGVDLTQDKKSSDAVEKHFSPEFRNRLDAIVNFNGLGDDLMVKIVDKFIRQGEARFSDKGIVLEVSDSVKLAIAKAAFDPKMGARPIARAVQKRIFDSLVDEILFGKLQNGGKVVVTENNGELEFAFTGE